MSIIISDFCEPFFADSAKYLSFDPPVLGKETSFLVLQVILVTIALTLLENPKWRNRSRSAAAQTGTGLPPGQVISSQNEAVAMGTLGYSRVSEDADVTAEKERLWSRPIDELKQLETVLILGLKKYYGRKLAVDDVSLGIQQGECFGLLGANGAGKTSVFQMLTGGRRVSAGQIYISGNSVLEQLSKVYPVLLNNQSQYCTTQ